MKHTNVLILMTDQQRFDTIAAAGFPHMITPNLDRLAAMGTLFTCAHTSNPVCMAARHDLLTGQTGRAHGYFANSHRSIKDAALPTLPGIFSSAGYRTAAIGKCHHYPVRAHHGFAELHLMEEIPESRGEDQYALYLESEGLGEVQNIHGVRPHVYHIPQKAQMDGPHHGSAWVANRTLRWLEENGEEPFFLFCSWIHPHPPWDVPEEFRGAYADRALPKPVPVSRTWPEPAGFPEWFGDCDSEEQKRAIRAAYLESITCADHAIGRILDDLERRGRLDDTLILFFSDHGEMLQDKGYYSKEVPYEGSVRIPMIVKLPASMATPAHLPRGGTCDGFVDLLDVLPTCLQACGLAYPPSEKPLLGRSLCDEAMLEREIQISSWGEAPSDRWVMARDRNNKYIFHYNAGFEEFYDLSRDPGEVRNLIPEAPSADVVSRLRAAALAWERHHGPDWALEQTQLIAHPAQEHSPSQCGKFHLWSQEQMPAHDPRSPEERSKAFLREIQYALSDTRFSGVALNDVFNDPQWIEHFMECWKTFGIETDIGTILFKQPRI